MLSIPLSNKMWRKIHLFKGEYITKKENVPKKRDIFKDVVVDKNNHKIKLAIINNKAYRVK